MHSPLILISLLFSLGILIARSFNVPLFFLYLSCGFFLVLALFFLKEKVRFNIFISCSIIFLGGVFYGNFQLLPSNHIINLVSEEPRLICLEGIILNEPIWATTSYGEEKISFLLEAKGLKFASGDTRMRTIKGRVKVTVFGKEGRYSYGDRLFLEGYLSLPQGPRNPGGLDYKEYLARQRIYTLFKVKQENSLKVIKNEGSPAVKCIFSIKEKLRKLINTNLPQPEGSLLSAIILGDREDLPGELEDCFIKTGTVHILAISGLHIGIVVFVLLTLFKVLRLERRLRYILVIFLLIVYAILTGARPPVVRATIMAIVLLFGWLISREVDIYNSLGLASLIILIENPSQLFDAGTQLSFLCVIAIVYFSPKITSLKQSSVSSPKTKSQIPITRTVFRWFGVLQNSFFVSLSAWLGIIPVVAYHFNIISPVTILANLIVVPFISIIVALGFNFILAGLLSPFLGKIFAASTSLSLKGLIHFTGFISKLPFAYSSMPGPGYLYIICYYLLLLVVFNYRKHGLSLRRLSILLLVVLNLLIWKGVLTCPDDRLKVTFFDVRYGDSAFVEFPKFGNMLIDGGSAQEGDSGRWVIMPFLRSKGINTIDAIVLSHPHEDHIGGLGTIIRNFRTRYIFDNGQPASSSAYTNYLKAIKEEKILHQVIKEGDQITGYNASIYILHPPAEFLRDTHSDTNNNSLVLKIIYKNTSLLFCGDIEEDAMKRLVPYDSVLTSCIIKVPHHGADAKEVGELFFAKVHPKVAIVSVAGTNRFNVPSIRTLNLFKELGSRVYQTDTKGAITVSADGKGFLQISTQ